MCVLGGPRILFFIVLGELAELPLLLVPAAAKLRNVQHTHSHTHKYKTLEYKLFNLPTALNLFIYEYIHNITLCVEFGMVMITIFKHRPYKPKIQTNKRKQREAIFLLTFCV